MSTLWFGSGFIHWDLDTIPPTDFWFGLVVVLLFQSWRISRYVQRDLEEKPALGQQFAVWSSLTSPYFLESCCYLFTASALASLGGSETLTYRPGDQGSASELLILVWLCILLLPLCAGVMGWKLSASKLPVFLPIVTAVQLTMVIQSASFVLNIGWLRDSFPLLPVVGVTVSALGFLLLGCRTNSDWLTTRKPPNSSMLVACLIPAAFPLLLVFEHIAFALFVAILTVLACGPVYFLAWLVPWRPQTSFERWVGCFVVGMLASYSLVITGAILVVVEDAWLSPILSYDPARVSGPA